MFTIHSHDTGAVLPWEYLPAQAGTYKAGQLLETSTGQLAPIAAVSKTTPGYLCMADITVVAGGMLPVTRIQRDVIYETQLSADGVAAVGEKLEVSAGGLQVDANAQGTFELVYAEDGVAGSTVRGRFI